MSFAIGAPVPWPLPPDWDEPVRETLAWLTDVLQARGGVRQKRELRLAPRRTLAFDVFAEVAERRLLDALRFDHGARLWELPLWFDVQPLSTAVAGGVTTIGCRTAGFDFVAGGQALLWRAINAWELVSIDTVGATSLTLAAATGQAWPAGTRLYPTRKARLQDTPQETMWSDDASRVRVAFAIDEPCDWPAALPPTLYRNSPVLEWRPDESEDPKSSYGRMLTDIDQETGPVAQVDLPNQPFRTQDHHWLVHGRSENGDFRALLYGLRGRMAEIWVPSWNADLQLAAAVADTDTAISVDWCGYTVFGREQSNRRDIRIELFDGTVLYRRITDSVEAGATETLTLDAALGVAAAPGQVRAIGFLTLMQLASDSVEIEHVTDADGLSLSTTRFEAIAHDL